MVKTPYSSARSMIEVGDNRDILRSADDGVFRTCITSPPYWGLRDYGTPPTVWDADPECNHDWGPALTGGFRGGAKDDGYKASKGSGHEAGGAGQFCFSCPAWRGQLGLEPTPELFVDHLVQVFREVRRTLADDGTLWLVMGDTYARRINSGGSKMTGRTKGDVPKRSRMAPGLKQGDLVGVPWMLAFALRADGWYLRAENIWHKPNAMPESVRSRTTRAHEQVFLLSKKERYFYDHAAIKEPAVSDHASGNGFKRPHRLTYGGRGKKEQWQVTKLRNKRSVWSLNTRQFPGAHFAVFPHTLVEPMVLAGSEEGDWVLDPFVGTGTTGAVANALGRNFGGCELNPEYASMAAEEIKQYVEERATIMQSTETPEKEEVHGSD